MKRIPIVNKFGGVVIGFMEIDERFLPDHGNYCFTIGGEIDLATEGMKPGDVPSKPHVGPFNLTEVAIASDVEYAAYLKQIGVV